MGRRLRPSRYPNSYEIPRWQRRHQESRMTALDKLATLPRWVAWRNEKRDEKITKVPYSPRGDRKAEANDPSTWGTRAEAEARAGVIVNGAGGGIGIELGDLGNGEM